MKRPIFSWHRILFQLGRRWKWHAGLPREFKRVPVWESLEPRHVLAALPFVPAEWLNSEKSMGPVYLSPSGIIDGFQRGFKGEGSSHPNKSPATMNLGSLDSSLWSFEQYGGSSTGKASFSAGKRLTEGDSFVALVSTPWSIPEGIDFLSFDYEVGFDRSGSFIHDSFEVGLVDVHGRSLVPTFAHGRDSFFNLTEGQSPRAGTSTSFTVSTVGDMTSGSVTLDLGVYPTGTLGKIVLRLVNNDNVSGDDNSGYLQLKTPNERPIAVDDSYIMNQGTVLSVSALQGLLGNDTDPDSAAGDLRSRMSVSPTQGTLALNVDGSFQYTPLPSFFGTDSFTYYVEDEGGSVSNVATVAIVVHPTRDEYLVVPGTPGTVTTLVLNVTSSETAYRNEFGFYILDSVEGTVHGNPTITTPYSIPNTVSVTALSSGAEQTDYFRAALHSPSARVVFPQGFESNPSQSSLSIELPAGTMLGFFLVQNGSISQQLASNNSNFIGAYPNTFFSFSNANPDNKFKHFRHTVQPNSVHRIGAEDVAFGGDQDFNDIVFEIRAVTTAPTSLKFHVVDANMDRNFQYSSNGKWIGSQLLAPTNMLAKGNTSNADGTRMWIVDASNTVYVYETNPSSGFQSLLGTWSIADLPVGATVHDIALSGTSVWVVTQGANVSDRNLYKLGGAAKSTPGDATTWISGIHSVTNSTLANPVVAFPLETLNGDATGLAASESKLWVTNAQTDEVFVYTSEGTFEAKWRLAQDNVEATDITNDPTGTSDDLWTIDRATKNIYQYDGAARFDRNNSTPAIAKNIYSLGFPNVDPQGIADPPPALSARATSSILPPGNPVLVHGLTEPGAIVTNSIASATTLDAAGNFFFFADSLDTPQTISTTSIRNGESSTVNVGVQSHANLNHTFENIVPELLTILRMDAVYQTTSIHFAKSTLYADVQISNHASYTSTGPMWLGVRNISRGDVVLKNATGVARGEIPYIDITDRLQGGKLGPGARTEAFTLEFSNPSLQPFTYELVLFSAPNQSPAFTSIPNVVARSNEAIYRYDANAIDPEGAPLTFSLLEAPSNMTIDPDTGAILWTTGSGNSSSGSHSIAIGVKDSSGLSDIQRFVLSVLESSAVNRPPQWTSTPITEAYVGTAYLYSSAAEDPDADSLTFTKVSGPASLTIESRTGRILWLPTDEDFGFRDIVVRVTDHGSPSLYADHSFRVFVGSQPGNRPPVIVSEPRISQGIALSTSGTVIGDVTPVQPIVSNLIAGQSSTHTITYTRSPSLPKADVMLLLDDTGSMAASWLPIVGDMQSAFEDLVADYGQTDFAFGVSRFEDYNVFDPTNNFSVYERPYTLNQPLYRTADPGFERFFAQALGRMQPGNGGDLPETAIEALYQLATGAGLDYGSRNDLGLHQPNASPFDSGYASELDTQSGVTYGTRGPAEFLALMGKSGDVPPANAPRKFGYRILRVSDLPSLATSARIPLRTVGVVQEGKGVAAWRFNSKTANQVLRLQSNGSKDFRWNLYDPNGIKILDDDVRVPYRIELPMAGQYVLALDSQIDLPNQYQFGVALAPAIVTPLHLDTNVSGSISAAAQVDRYKFQLESWKAIYFDSRSLSAGLRWTLLGPDERPIASEQFSDAPLNNLDDLNDVGFAPNSSGGKLMYLAPGDYRLEIRSGEQEPGPNARSDYTFALMGLDSAGTPVPFDGILGANIHDALPIGAMTKMYSLEISASGQAITINNPAIGGNVSSAEALYQLYLIDNFGRVLYAKSNHSSPDDFGSSRLVLGNPGTYRLLFDGSLMNENRSTLFSISIAGGNSSEISVPAALTLGQTYSGNLALGQSIDYSLDLSSSSEWKTHYVDSLLANPDLQISLFASSGALVAQSFLDGTRSDFGNHSDAGSKLADQIKVLAPGRYRLSLTRIARAGSSTSHGNFSFRVLDLIESSSNLTLGSSVTSFASLADPENGARVYKLRNASDTHVYFDGISGTARWQLIAPDGTNMTDENGGEWQSTGVDIGSKRLKWVGDYFLIVDGWPTSSGTEGSIGSFRVLPVDNISVPITLASVDSVSTQGTYTTTQMPTLASIRAFTFAVTKPTLAYFEPGATSYTQNVRWSLKGPSGTLVSNRPFDRSAVKLPLVPTSIVPDSAQFLNEGIYTLTLDQTSSGSATASFRLVDLASSGTALVNDQVLVQSPQSTPPPPPGTRFFHFDGRRGDYFQLDFSETGVQFDFDPTPTFDLRVRILDPFGMQVYEGMIDPVSIVNGLPEYNTELSQSRRWKFDLEATGRYTILVEDIDGGSVSNTFTLKPKTLSRFPPSQVSSFSPGGKIQDNTIHPEKLLYDASFKILAGERYLIDGLTATGRFPVDLLQDNGVGMRRIARSDNNVGIISANLAQSLLMQTYSNSAPFSYGRLGGAGFRPDAIPIIIMATDNWSVYRPESPQPLVYQGYGGVQVDADHLTGFDPVSQTPRTNAPALRRESAVGNEAQIQRTIDALVQLGAYVIPVFSDVTSPIDPNHLESIDELAVAKTFYDFPQALARLTGAINGSSEMIASGDNEFPIAPGMPLTFFFTPQDPNSPPTANTILTSQLSSAVRHLLEKSLLDVDVIASDPSVAFENLTGSVADVDAGQTATFQIRITGEIRPRNFDLLFVRKGTGNILGKIPVRITDGYIYDADAIDPDQDALSYTLLGPTHGATIDSASGQITWNPTIAGVFEFAMSVSDGRGGRDSQTWSVTVGGDLRITSNTVPVLDSIPNLSATATHAFSYQTIGMDPDRDPLLYLLEPTNSNSPLPNGLTIHPRSGEIQWTPSISQIGTYSATVKVLDGRGGIGTRPVSLTVSAPQPTFNSPPIVAPIPNATVQAGVEYRYRFKAIDPQGDPVQFRLSIGSERLAVIDPITDTLFWTPRLTDIGHVTMVVAAVDSRGSVSTLPFQFQVTGPNRSPVFENAALPESIHFASLHSFRFSAIDPDGDPISYSLGLRPNSSGILTTSPPGAKIDPTTGVLTWLPGPTQSGLRFDVQIIADDGRGGRTIYTWPVSVSANPLPNHLPYFTTTPRTLLQPGVRWTYRPEAFDSDGDAIQFVFGSVSGSGFPAGSLPAGMSFDLGSRTFSWIPSISQIGTLPIRQEIFIGITDSATTGTSLIEQRIRLTVSAIEKNDPPRFHSVPINTILSAGQSWTYGAQAIDPDNDPVTYSVIGPTGMVIHRHTGKIEWIPRADQLGKTSVIVTAIDPYGAADTQAFELEVRSTDLPPVIDSTPIANALFSTRYQYQMLARDPEGKPLFYALTSNVSNASISSTGMLSWDVPSSGLSIVALTITVHTGPGTASANQAWIVHLSPTAIDRPPIIMSVPTWVAGVGDLYTYQIVAIDPDNPSGNPNLGITYSLPTRPRTSPTVANATNMVISPSGLIAWTPVVGHLSPGIEPFEVLVTSNGKAARQRVPVAVLPSNREPIFTPPAMATVVPNQLLAMDLVVTDADHDTIRFVLNDAPTGMTLDRNGRLRWQTLPSQSLGTYSFTVLATDDRGQPEANVSLSVMVAADTVGPSLTLSSSPNPARTGLAWKIDLDAFDISGVAGYSLKWNSSSNATLQSLPVSHDGIAWMTPSIAEMHTFTATAIDLFGNTTTLVRALNVADNSGAPTVSIASPIAGSKIESIVEIVGAVSDSDLVAWTLSVYDSKDTLLQTLASSSMSRPAGSVLGQIDATRLPSEWVRIELFAIDAAGQSSVATRAVSAISLLKIGNFNVSFNDLALDLGGLPISIVRTYDSLKAAQNVGDFGPGWSLQWSSVASQVEPTTLGGLGNRNYPAFTNSTRLSIKLPDGRYEGFTFRALQTGGGGLGGAAVFQPTFVPDSGNTSLLGVNQMFLTDPFNTGAEFWSPDGWTYNPMDPILGSEFLLQTADGLRYAIDPRTGEMKHVSDRNGNKLLRDNSGIYTSLGRGITFTRDWLGNIVAITDPRGNAISYEYDYTHNVGRLIGFRDRLQTYNQKQNREDKKSTYSYLPLRGYENYLHKVLDPNGQVSVQANYDLAGGSTNAEPTGSGRLQSMIDATGAAVKLTYTINAAAHDYRQRIYAQDQSPNDPAAKYSEIVFDADGRPIRQTEPSGVTTLTEYASNSVLPLPTMQSVVIGTPDTPAQIAAGLGDDLITRTTYSSNGLPKEQIDPQGNKTTYQYDTSGQAISSTDAFGNGTFYSYTGLAENDRTYRLPVLGNLRTSGDGVNATQMSYDQAGNVTTITSPARRPDVPEGFVWPVRSDYPNGAAGDAAFQTAWDAAFAIYNAALERASRGELDGPVTKLAYNTFGDLKSTEDPDGSVRTNTIDNNGNRTETQFVWKDPKNSTKTVTLTTGASLDVNDRPTGSSGTVGGVAQPTTQTFYDALGRAWRTIDTNGLETQATFDKRGLVIQSRSQSRDALGNLVWSFSRTVYDSNGRAILATETVPEGTAVGEIYGTRSIYNKAGQVTSTQRLKSVDILISGAASDLVSLANPIHSAIVVSTATTLYAADNSGRVIETTDAFGKRSQIFYDRWNRTVESRSETRSAIQDASGGTASDQWLVTRSVYDSHGRVVFSSDPYTVHTNVPLGPSAGNSPAVYGSRTYYDARGRAFRSARVADAIIGFNVEANQTLLINAGTEVSFTTTEYDSQERAFRQTASDGQITLSEYDSRDRVIATLGHAVDSEQVGLASLYPNKKVRLRNETNFNAYGQSFQSITNVIEVLTPATLVVEQTDRSHQRVTEQIFDAQGRVFKTLAPDGTHTQREYDSFGRVIAEIDQLGNRKDLLYDSVGRLIQVQLPAVPNPLNAFVATRPTYRYEYNTFGQMTKLTDANNNITQFGFNAIGQSIFRTLPLGQTETTSYDQLQRVTLQVSFEGVYHRTVYDDSPAGGGRVLRHELFKNQSDYNAFMSTGALASGVLWERVSLVYDAFGRTVSTTHVYADGATPVAGDPILGKPSSAIYNDVWTQEFDAQGRLIQETAPKGVLGHEYDALGRKIRTWAAGPGGTSSAALSDIHYAYDALGRLSMLSTVKRDGAIVDSNGTAPGTPSETTKYRYDILGRMDYTEMPNEIVEDYTFDNMDRLDVLKHYQSDANNGVLADNILRDTFDYSYRNDGKRTTLAETFHTASPLTNVYTWSYDNAGRLVTEQLDSHDNTLDQMESYIMDLVGNRIRRTLDKPSTDNDVSDMYLYDFNDRLISENRFADLSGLGTAIRSTNYTWAGTQQTTKSVASVSSLGSRVTSYFSYGLMGQLERVVAETKDGSNMVTSRNRVDYRYDARSVRFISTDYTSSALTPESWSLQSSIEYLVDHANMTGYAQTILETTRNGAGQVSKRISYTIGADEVTQTTTDLDPASGLPSQSSTLTFGHDGHGSTRALYGAIASFSQVFTYSAYGELLAIYNATGARDGANGGSTSSLASPLGAKTGMLYNGEGIDTRTDLYNFRARWYSSSSGRFERQDPFGGNPNDPFSFNKYGFAHSNPINGSDPSGLSLLGGTISAGAIGGALLGGTAGGVISAYSGTNIFLGIASGAAAGALAGAGLVWAGSAAIAANGWLATSLLGLLSGEVGYIAFQEIWRSSQKSQAGPAPTASRARHDYDYALLSLDVYGTDLQLAQQVKDAGWTFDVRTDDFRNDFQSYHARLYTNIKRGEMVMVYEGSTPSTSHFGDWANNIQQGTGLFAEGYQFQRAKEDGRAALARAQSAGRPLHFTGHSLGGGLATAAALATGRRATTFNASGVNPATTYLTGASQRIVNYRVTGEVLSTLQDSFLFGWALPDSSAGVTYWLRGRSTSAFARHTDDILQGIEEFF